MVSSARGRWSLEFGGILPKRIFGCLIEIYFLWWWSGKFVDKTQSLYEFYCSRYWSIEVIIWKLGGSRGGGGDLDILGGRFPLPPSANEILWFAHHLMSKITYVR